MEQLKIEVMKSGPLLVTGTFVLIDDQGNEEIKSGNLALCRCGASKNKPFCDGLHRTTDVLSC